MKLPNIFHGNEKFMTNNRHSCTAFNKKEEQKEESSFSSNDLINYFNKNITIHLKNGNSISGILISKRNKIILLNTGEHINIDDISSIN
jgi:small nuclear ribonucleoprotein (snRNP)-like protein